MVSTDVLRRSVESWAPIPNGAHPMPPTSSVLLPLYIYPLPDAWAPLYHAISACPDVQFTIILNPHNGPGSSTLPDDCYSREISKLNAQPNVLTVGYVRIDYCKRPLAEVFEDVDKYAGWSVDYSTSGLAVHGIFFDETPNLFSNQVATYLNYITQYAKAAAGILGEQLVIHNPGTVPDAGLAAPGPDVTAVVEESYRMFKSVELQERLTSLLRYDRTRCCYIVHSVPRNEIKQLVLELRHRGQYLFVTDLRERYYEKFGQGWDDFVEAMRVK